MRWSVAPYRIECKLYSLSNSSFSRENKPNNGTTDVIKVELTLRGDCFISCHVMWVNKWWMHLVWPSRLACLMPWAPRCVALALVVSPPSISCHWRPWTAHSTPGTCNPPVRRRWIWLWCRRVAACYRFPDTVLVPVQRNIFKGHIYTKLYHCTYHIRDGAATFVGRQR